MKNQRLVNCEKTVHRLGNIVKTFSKRLPGLKNQTPSLSYPIRNQYYTPFKVPIQSLFIHISNLWILWINCLITPHACFNMQTSHGYNNFCLFLLNSFYSV